MSGRRAVVVGCGSIWPTWSRLLKDRGIEVAGFVDLDRDRAARAAAAFGGGVAATDLGEALEALAGQGVELLVNLTPPPAHARTILDGLSAGLDVITEKPLVVEPADGQRVIDAARAAGRSVSVMQNRRHEPTFGPLAEFAAALPGPVHLSCDFFVPWTYGGFRDTAGSPLLEDLLIHTMDQARCLVGSPPAWVFCHESTIAGSWMAGDAVVTATVGFEDGSVLGYRGSWCAGGERTSWNGRWRLSAHDCSAHWDGERPATVVTSELDDSGRPTERLTERELGSYPGAGGHERGLDEILGALARRSPSQTDAAANLLSVAMIAAARTSSREHRVATIAEVLDGGNSRP
ncbi:Gfo/Idh/MocA family oxidoreductase [Streptomyces polygonati]|uniref:Gfo/Idh/MocA family oxidoreductase n=1 Tax=Streptomyces polygonati TaxID=1617087 RepID=A0ABV8I0I6_9ACTN